MRRVALLASLLALLPPLISYRGVLNQTSDSSLGIRTVEWMRDHGARGLVNEIENLYYTLNAPATGGPALHALPQQPGARSSGPAPRSHVAVAYRPAPIPPVIHPSLPGEGIWRSSFAGLARRPPVLISNFRPDPNYPQLVAGVAWIDTRLTTTWLYPGRLEPAVSLPSRGPMQVPARLRSRLVATFNSGFKLSDSGGGFATGGRTYKPLKNGLATIVRYRDGRIDITSWQGGPQAPPNVIYARQNLPLIIDHHRLNQPQQELGSWRQGKELIGVVRAVGGVGGPLTPPNNHSWGSSSEHRSRSCNATSTATTGRWPGFDELRGCAASRCSTHAPNRVVIGGGGERVLTADFACLQLARQDERRECWAALATPRRTRGDLSDHPS